MKTLLLSALVLIALPCASFASDEMVRLDRNGGSLERLAILDQEQIPNCYAYTAFQMIEAYRFSHEKGKDLKPASFANISILSNFFNTPMLLTGAKYASVCSDEKMKAFLGGMSDNEFYNSIRIYEVGHTSYEHNAEYARQLNRPPPPDAAIIGIMRFLKKRLDEKSLEELRPIVAQYAFRQDYLWGEEILSRVCKDDLIQLNLPKFESISIKENLAQQGLKKISDQLAGYFVMPQSQPVEISFCPDIIKGHPESRISPTCLKHSAILIGKRNNDSGGHDFLLRNSWGPNWCPPASPGIECDGRGGQAWISDSILLKAASDFTAWSKSPEMAR